MAGNGTAAPLRQSGPATAHGESPARDPGRVIDLGSEIAGDDAIVFRKHGLDLGCAESVTVANMNQ